MKHGDERYTTGEQYLWVKSKTGIIKYDLDVAACAEAYAAPVYYTKTDNGLVKPWFGHVWCNPPYSKIGPWVAKAWEELSNCRSVSMLIPANRTDQKWWQEQVEPVRDGGEILKTFFMPGRGNFAYPGSQGVAEKGSPFGCVLLFWRNP